MKLPYIGYGSLQSRGIVVHIITPKAQRAHEEEEQEPVHPAPRVTREERHTTEPLLFLLFIILTRIDLYTGIIFSSEKQEEGEYDCKRTR